MVAIERKPMTLLCFGLACALRVASLAAIARTQSALFGQHAVRSRPTWHDATFFNAFSQAESTYDDEADYGRPQNQYFDGWEPGIENPYEGSIVQPEFFHESPSGGHHVAWQTHYPAVQSGVGGDVSLPSWFRGSGGEWKQRYGSDPESTRATAQGSWLNELKGTGRLPANWFDASANQVDGFGRHRYPSMESPKHYTSYQERSVNTTLSCPDPGCTANASLQAFNGTMERARNCKLNVLVKPTDYDEQYSGERIEWISVNDVNVSLNCEPLLSGCNATAARPYYPCVFELRLDKLMPPSGTLQLAAKIPKIVDECPYQGSLLYAVPVVTCLVARQVPPPYYPSNYPPLEPTNITFGGGYSFNESSMELSAWSPLKCRERGCTAAAFVALNFTQMTFSKCSLTVKINATDFDNEEWGPAAELIEFIKVEGVDQAVNLNPAINPCKEKYAGSPIPQRLIEKAVMSGADVTADAGDGVLVVEAKISPVVDECAMEGNLLDGRVEVTCSVAAAKPTAMLQDDSDTHPKPIAMLRRPRARRSHNKPDMAHNLS